MLATAAVRQNAEIRTTVGRCDLCPLRAETKHRFLRVSRPIPRAFPRSHACFSVSRRISCRRSPDDFVGSILFPLFGMTAFLERGIELASGLAGRRAGREDQERGFSSRRRTAHWSPARATCSRIAKRHYPLQPRQERADGDVSDGGIDPGVGSRREVERGQQVVRGHGNPERRATITYAACFSRTARRCSISCSSTSAEASFTTSKPRTFSAMPASIAASACVAADNVLRSSATSAS